jgi:hypothetical protein
MKPPKRIHEAKIKGAETGADMFAGLFTKPEK